jgi:hypothetical protein
MLDEPMTTDESPPPAEDDDTIGWTVPNFFVEDDEPALRSQAGWTGHHLGLSDGFFARFLRVAESSFRDWRLGQAELPADRQDALRNFWHTVRHLLSFTDLDEQKIRALLERRMPVDEGSHPHPLDPPWIGSTMKSYLEEGGPDVLPNVDRWVTGFRFGNPYAS